MVQELLARKEKLAVLGLGYVGLPIAAAFAEKIEVIGFDTNRKKIESYLAGKDPTGEVGDDRMKNAGIRFTSDEKLLRDARFFIVAVPTPVYPDKRPNLDPVEEASRILGRNLPQGSIVVFESTVYPGVTENVCVPVLERESGLRCGEGFRIAYSPERINPGDKTHRLHNIRKIVSGMDEETLDCVAGVYGLIVQAGVFRAKSIQVAEAAKLAENAQRDINIAFMNELSRIFHKIGINTWDVLEAMNTKWNALGFTPGLVGGHCIGVDPYYFIYQAENLGYHSQIIQAGRRVNDDMSAFVANAAVEELIHADRRVKGAKIYVLGVTFKENCPDLRNSRVFDIVQRLRGYGAAVHIVDPVADQDELVVKYGMESVSSLEKVGGADSVLIAVAHEQFRTLKREDLRRMYRTDTHEPVLLDIKRLFSQTEMEADGFRYWSL